MQVSSRTQTTCVLLNASQIHACMICLLFVCMRVCSLHNSSVSWGHGTNTHWGGYSSHTSQSLSSSDAPEKQDRLSVSPEKPLWLNLRMIIMTHTILNLFRLCNCLEDSRSGKKLESDKTRKHTQTDWRSKMWAIDQPFFEIHSFRFSVFFLRQRRRSSRGSFPGPCH